MDRKNIETNPLVETYGRYIQKINQALDTELGLYSESEFIDPLKYSMDGGKRIRLNYFEIEALFICAMLHVCDYIVVGILNLPSKIPKVSHRICTLAIQ